MHATSRGLGGLVGLRVLLDLTLIAGLRLLAGLTRRLDDGRFGDGLSAAYLGHVLARDIGPANYSGKLLLARLGTQLPGQRRPALRIADRPARCDGSGLHREVHPRVRDGVPVDVGDQREELLDQR